MKIYTHIKYCCFCRYFVNNPALNKKRDTTMNNLRKKWQQLPVFVCVCHSNKNLTKIKK